MFRALGAQCVSTQEAAVTMGRATQFIRLLAVLEARHDGPVIAADGSVDPLPAIRLIMECMEELKEDIGALRFQAGFDE